MNEDLFTFVERKDGTVAIARGGREVTVLGGAKARKFLSAVHLAEATEAQLLMAKATGNYKRGNERAAGGKGRNRSSAT
jgi:hypothetical protein